MGRLWRKWYGKLGLIALTLAIALVTAGAAAVHFTEGSEFCGTSCHEMSPYYVTWQTSAHRNLECVRCHIRPGVLALAKAKVAGLHEVYEHTRRSGSAPVYVTRHIPNATCTSCHLPGKGHDPLKLKGVAPVAFSHKVHAGTQCIDCHSQVVHRTTPGHPYVNPRTMAFCQRCHNGTQAPSACATCHEAPHPPRGTCETCHTQGSWRSTFTHTVQIGAHHAKVACERCHTQGLDVGTTGAKVGLPAGCASCHDQRHQNLSIPTTRCAQCHRPSHFVPATFKHPATDCLRCHTSPHPYRGACTRCHDQRSWAPTLQHPVTLAGVHTTFTCEKCHTKGFSQPGLSCTSCHGANHGGLTNCASCHQQSGWQPSTFQHPSTGMGGISGMACSSCHPNGAFARVYCTCHGGNSPGG